MMSGRKCSKFWWGVWLGDQGVRKCSLAARGLWMDMLAIMATEDPIGYLTDAGDPLSPEGLASLCGAPVAVVLELLDELARRKVFSRTRGGLIYCRRMVRDEITASKNRDNGRMGGNPALMLTHSDDEENGTALNREDKRGDIPRGRSKMLRKKDNTPPPFSVAAGDVRGRSTESGGGDEKNGGEGAPHPGTSELVAQVGRAVATIHDRPRNEHATDRATVEGWLADGFEPHQVLAAVTATASAEAEKGSPPPTALKFYDRAVRDGRRAPVPAEQRHDEGVLETELSRWKARTRAWQKSGMWLTDNWGPPPDQPRTVVPKSVLADLGLTPP